MLLMSFIGPAYEEAGEAENTTPLFNSDSDSNSVSGIESCASFHHLRKTKKQKTQFTFHTHFPTNAGTPQIRNKARIRKEK
jgi:hypothetical protein